LRLSGCGTDFEPRFGFLNLGKKVVDFGDGVVYIKIKQASCDGVRRPDSTEKGVFKNSLNNGKNWQE